MKNCIDKIGSSFTKNKMYSTILGAYDVILGMDWVESHRSLVDCYEKKFFFNYDFEEPMIIEGIKWDIYMWFISIAKVKKCIMKGCKFFVIEAMSNER